jgi:hypothetical protein
MLFYELMTLHACLNILAFQISHVETKSDIDDEKINKYAALTTESTRKHWIVINSNNFFQTKQQFDGVFWHSSAPQLGTRSVIFADHLSNYEHVPTMRNVVIYNDLISGRSVGHICAGPRQHSHSRLRITEDSLLHFEVSWIWRSRDPHVLFDMFSFLCARALPHATISGPYIYILSSLVVSALFCFSILLTASKRMLNIKARLSVHFLSLEVVKTGSVPRPSSEDTCTEACSRLPLNACNTQDLI